MILKNPKAYHNRRVSVEGVMVGNGPIFELYKNAPDSQRPAPVSECFYVVSQKGRPLVGTYDLHKVRVTGIVDANRHGNWGNPCTIVLEKIEVLSVKPVAVSQFPTAVFRNEGAKSLVVRLLGGVPEVSFAIPPRSAVETIISDGEEVRVFSASGSPILQDRIRGLERSSPYYDVKTGNFFYRIAGNKIERVLPGLAKDWNWRQ
ncbi:MAG: hypothetical protein ACREIF_13970 [Chthoniobacterales bacterium]